MKKKIAICGTRGVPSSYGGFETFAEELGSRLVNLGYEIIVYCRHYGDGSEVEKEYFYKGMKCLSFKAIKHKYFETPLHTLRSFLTSEIRSVDIVLLCNAANSPFSFIPKIFGKPIVINVDGIERERRKWNFLGKLWYYFGEVCSVFFASKLVSDANYIRDYYRKKYGRDSSVIRYGARQIDPSFLDDKCKNLFDKIYQTNKDFYDNHKLMPGKYLLYVSRLEPENNADKVISAYNLLKQEIKKEYELVVVGDAPYANEYKEGLIKLARGTNVRFLGYQFGSSYELLQTGAYLYVQATEVGGTHPALVEAMGFANAIVANDVVEHIEVIKDVAEVYKYNDINSLSEKIARLIEKKDLTEKLRIDAYQRSLKDYSWDSVVLEYVKLFSVYLEK